MSKLTDDMLRDWIRAVNADGTNWGMAIECMANDLLELRAELAAIRGAGDEEVGARPNEIKRLVDSLVEEYDGPLNSKQDAAVRDIDTYASELAEIAKARGQKIAEQAKEIEVAIRDRDNFWKFLTNEMKQNTGANEAQKQREIAACERAKIPYGGCDTVHDLADLIAVLTTERDAAIGLLKHGNYHLDLEDILPLEAAKRLRKLTAK